MKRYDLSKVLILGVLAAFDVGCWLGFLALLGVL